MKAKLIYSVVFISVFLVVTAGIIYFNNQYRNIFRFDFTKAEVKKMKIDSLKNNVNSFSQLKDFIENKLKKDLLDSLKTLKTEVRVDTIKKEIVIDSSLTDSLKNIRLKLNTLQNDLAARQNENNIMKSSLQVKNDSAYVKWKREMVKIYEKMDSKAAAKIIQNLADNLARDILFAMKKKKAAEIITKLNPETATRLTRMQ